MTFPNNRYRLRESKHNDYKTKKTYRRIIILLRSVTYMKIKELVIILSPIRFIFNLIFFFMAIVCTLIHRSFINNLLRNIIKRQKNKEMMDRLLFF